MADDGPGAGFDGNAAARLRRTYGAQAVVRQRERTRRRLAVTAGERVLDLGCGPGLLAVELAEEVGDHGHVTAMDPSEAMRRVASEEVRARGVASRVSVVAGDAGAIPMDTDEVVAVVAVQVLEHVPDVAGALREMRRVLTPDGRLVVVDTDWRSCVWHSADPELGERVIGAWRSHFPHPQLPVELDPALRDAGFAEVDVEPLTLLERRIDGDAYSLGMVGTIAAFVADHPDVGREDATRWRDDVRARAADGTAFFSLTRYQFTARG